MSEISTSKNPTRSSTLDCTSAESWVLDFEIGKCEAFEFESKSEWENILFDIDMWSGENTRGRKMEQGWGTRSTRSWPIHSKGTLHLSTGWLLVHPWLESMDRNICSWFARFQMKDHPPRGSSVRPRLRPRTVVVPFLCVFIHRASCQIVLLRPDYTAHVELQQLAKSLPSEHQHFVIHPLPQHSFSIFKVDSKPSFDFKTSSPEPYENIWRWSHINPVA